jgi:transposase
VARGDGERRIADRLGPAKLEQLLGAAERGTPTRLLAERYGISESSVKRLIRRSETTKRSSRSRTSTMSGDAPVTTDRRARG